MEIKDMADILLKGGKMLGKSCPNCNAPLFQHEGRTFCARCNWEEGKAPPKEEGEKVEVKDKGPTPAEKTTKQETGHWKTLDDVQSAVLKRIKEYSDRLSDPGENANLATNIKTLSDLLDLLEKIVEMKGRRR